MFILDSVFCVTTADVKYIKISGKSENVSVQAKLKFKYISRYNKLNVMKLEQNCNVLETLIFKAKSELAFFRLGPMPELWG